MLEWRINGMALTEAPIICIKSQSAHFSFYSDVCVCFIIFLSVNVCACWGQTVELCERFQFNLREFHFLIRVAASLASSALYENPVRCYRDKEVRLSVRVHSIFLSCLCVCVLVNDARSATLLFSVCLCTCLFFTYFFIIISRLRSTSLSLLLSLGKSTLAANYNHNNNNNCFVSFVSRETETEKSL